MSRILAPVVAALAASVASAPAAMADDWRPVVRACQSMNGTGGACTNLGASFAGAWNIAFSPNGRHAYVAAYDDGSIHVFDRNTTTGALTRKTGAAGCVRQGGGLGCAVGHGLGEPAEILISDDGKQVYVTGWASDSIAILDRDTSTGELTQDAGQDGCVNTAGTDNCADGRAVGGASAAISKDGENLYVAGPNSLAVFDRDAATGHLTQQPLTSGCFGGVAGEGCATARGLAFAYQMALSSDGENLYLPSDTGRGILIFDRDTATGALSQKAGTSGCITFNGQPAGCATRPQLNSVNSTVLSIDEKQLYVSHSGGIVTFTRGANGVLSFRSCTNDAGTTGCSNGSHVTNLGYITPSPDGEELVADVYGLGSVTPATDGLTIFRRNQSTGDLTRAPGLDGCVSKDGRGFDGGVFVNNACRAHPAAGADGRIVFVGNEQFYAGFYTASSLLSFKRDFYPDCADKSVRVGHNTSVAIDMSCTDRNDDPLTLSIARQPAAGNLGAINQATRRVFYNPFSGFSGADSFTFRATGAGLQSPPATVRLSVAAGPPPPPPPPPPGPGGIDADGDGFFAGQDCNDGNAGIRPGAQEVRGNNIDENCDGVAAPFRSISVTLARDYAAFATYTTLKSLSVKKVPPGSTVRATCRVKGKKCKGKARKTFTKKRARGTVSLKQFTKVRLKAGTTITVTVTHPGRIGAVKILKIRGGKKPVTADRCLPPGATRPQARC